MELILRSCKVCNGVYLVIGRCFSKRDLSAQAPSIFWPSHPPPMTSKATVEVERSGLTEVFLGQDWK